MDIDSAIASLNLPFTLAPLQKEDALEGAMAGRYLLAYNVGGGKTVVATVIAKMWDLPHNLIIMPHILIPQWDRWLRKVGETDIGIYYGPKRSEQALACKWVLTSHAIFRDDSQKIMKFFMRKELAVFLDEAQVIKNPRSVTYKRLGQIIIPDRNLIMMTATPTSKPEDTYTFMKIKTEKLYRNFTHWVSLHVKEVDYFGAYQAYNNLDLLAQNFSLKMRKRTKLELFGDTLTPIYQELPYDLDAKHYKLYTKLAEEQLLLLPDGGKIDATSAQRLRHKLQQIVVNYSEFSGKETDRSAAYDLVDELISEVNPLEPKNSKLVFWTWYKSTSANLTAYLREKYGKEAVAAAYGGVDSAKGVHEIMFNEACRIGVFHPAAVGVGLELQHVCSEMAFIELSTSPIYMRQAIGRVDRPQQKRRPTIRFFQAQGTIQISLYNDLLANDELTSKIERSKEDLRKMIYGKP